MTNSTPTIAAVRNYTARDKADFILHVGDMSYADDVAWAGPSPRYEQVMDEFFRMIEPLASAMPYMVHTRARTNRSPKRPCLRRPIRRMATQSSRCVGVDRLPAHPTGHAFVLTVRVLLGTQVAPGNHDASCHAVWNQGCDDRLRNFSAYRHRWRMPWRESGTNSSENMWYSFDVGPVHFVVISTETDYPGAPPMGVSHTPGPFGDQMASSSETVSI